MTADLVVIGAGVIGCAVARKARSLGLRVVVVDRDVERKHASWAAAGMLAPLGESHEPGPFLSLLLEARLLFPGGVRQLEDETGLNLGYRTDGMILLAFDENGEAALERRQRWQEAAGLAVERLAAEEARRLEPGIDDRVRAALLFGDDHQIENRVLLQALEISAERAGVVFRLGVGARGLRPTTGGLSVELEDGDRLDAAQVVLAAGAWAGAMDGLPRGLPVEPVRGQILSVRNLQPPIRHILASSRGYLVPRSDGRVLVGATAERVGYATNTTLGGLGHLAGVAGEIAPDLAGQALVDHWSGLRPGTPDGLPILGPDPDLPALIYAAGHFRNGILLSFITGEIVGGLAAGIRPDFDFEPYRPDRFAKVT